MSSDGGAMAHQVSHLEQEWEKFGRVASAGRSVRLFLILGVVAFIGVFAWLFFKMINDLVSDPEAIVAAVEPRMEENMSLVSGEVQKLVTNSVPVLQQALADQAQKDKDKFLEALSQERVAFVENVQTRLNERVDTKFEEILTSHRQILKQEFPNVGDEQIEVMLGNFRVALDKAVKKYYGDQFQYEMNLMYKTWDDFPVAPEPKEDELPLTDQLVGHITELGRQLLIQSGEIKGTEPQE